MNEIRAFHDFDDRSSNASSASANTDTTEFFVETLTKSHRSSSSNDGEISAMEEEIIKASGIAIIRAAEKRLEENAKMKPEKVKLSSIQNVEKREDAHSGAQEEELSQQISQLSEEEQAALSEQLDSDDPFGSLDSREAEDFTQPQEETAAEEKEEKKD